MVTDGAIPLAEARRRAAGEQNSPPIDECEPPPANGPEDYGAVAPGPVPGPRGNGGRPGKPAWRAANPVYKSPQLKVIDPISLHGKEAPARRWIVPGWVPHDQVTSLNGDGGVGKTLAAQQLLTACATDRKWLGLPVMHCKTLGIFCEDGEDELWRRQEAINRHYDLEFGDLENMQWVSRVGEDNALVAFERFEAPAEPTEFFQQVHNLMQDFGAQLLVLDSLHDLFPGNENNRVHARQFVNLLRRYALDSDGAVLLTAHPSLQGLSSGTGTSGSTAWSNTVRSRLYLSRPKDDDDQATEDDQRILSRKKANYAGIGDKLDITWNDGVLVAEEQPQGVFAGIEQRSAEQAFLEGLQQLSKQGRPVSDSRNAGNFAPKVIAGLKCGRRYRYGELARAMERLFETGNICRQDVRYNGRLRPQIVIVEDGMEDED